MARIPDTGAPRTEINIRRSSAIFAERAAALFESQSTSLSLSAVAFIVACAAAFLLGHVLQAPTSGAWLFLPLALLVTLRWGLMPGFLFGLVSTLVTLTLLVPPIGLPIADDPRAYLRLAVATFGTLAAVLTVAELNRRRRTAEQQGRAEAESLAEIGRRVSGSLDLNDVLRIAVESAQRLLHADVVSIELTRSQPAMPAAAMVGNWSTEMERLIAPPDTGITRQVLESGGPIQVHWDDIDLSAAAHPAARHAMVMEGILSSLAMPIRRGTETVGLLWVHVRTTHHFTKNEIELLDRLAGQAAVAIANAQTLAEEQEARAEVEALLAATASLGVQAEPEAVLRTLVEQAASLHQVERAIFAVPREGRLIIPATWLRGEWVEGEFEPAPQGILRSVWESGRPYRTNDVASDPNANQSIAAHFDIHSQLTLPLVAPGGEHLGLISLNNSGRQEGFSERDERLLFAICETGAAVLLRARDGAARLEAERSAGRRKQEVEALLAAADQLNSVVDPAEVLRGVVRIASDLVSVRSAGVVTREGEHTVLRYTLTDGIWRDEETPLPPDDSLGGWVVQNGRPYSTEDFASAPFADERAATQGMPMSALLVPITARDGQVLGSLNLFDPLDNQPFSNEDQRLAEGLAHHAAIALERATLIQELRDRAVTDPLTGLPNRTRFLDRAASALADGKRRSSGVAVLFLDLDGFKVVNDSLGHHVGDILLQAVGQRLVACQPGAATVARFGGDEFAILLENVESSEAALEVANRVIADLNRPFTSDEYRALVIRASVGVTFRDAEAMARAPEELIREADIALYEAKAAGKAQAIGFVPMMSSRAIKRLELQTDLERALEGNEWRLLYQPIVHLTTQCIVGAEALLRWQHPRRGLLTPYEFIGLAEESGLILPIGRWVLGEACRQAVLWQELRRDRLPVGVSVNLSARQFEQPWLVEQVAAALEDSGLRPQALTLEITETTLIKNPELAIVTLAELKKLHVNVAIDDFGTGYSSLSYLRRLSVDVLKIDRSFIEELHRSDATAAIVQATIAMAHALGVSVTAEGIETEDQLSILQEFDYGQGFLLARPLTIEAFGKLATRRTA